MGIRFRVGYDLMKYNWNLTPINKQAIGDISKVVQDTYGISLGYRSDSWIYSLGYSFGHAYAVDIALPSESKKNSVIFNAMRKLGNRNVIGVGLAYIQDTQNRIFLILSCAGKYRITGC